MIAFLTGLMEIGLENAMFWSSRRKYSCTIRVHFALSNRNNFDRKFFARINKKTSAEKPCRRFYILFSFTTKFDQKPQRHLWLVFKEIAWKCFEQLPICIYQKSFLVVACFRNTLFCTCICFQFINFPFILIHLLRHMCQI